MLEYAKLVAFNWTFVFQILNTIILFLILRKLLFKPVKEMMLARQQRIQDTVDEADEINKQAQAFKKEYEIKLENIKEEGREIIKAARLKADEQYKEIINEAHERASMMIKHAEAEIERENIKAMNELKNEITSLAFITVEKVLKKKLDEKDHNELIQKFLEEVGEAEWQS
ncbi:MAG: F0F1 ATP synthase subunit B [Clostridiales bacterium]|nr:F0F1 ATP synthase subunit B [Clostridiales bacterium]